MNVSLLDEISKTNGIIGVTMSDPFSKLILAITGSRFNAIGCYYHSQVYGNPKCYVNIYNAHDGCYMRYKSNSLTLDELVTMPNLEYITVYPFKLTRKVPDNIDLDTIFRAAMFELVMDKHLEAEWSTIYKYLLLRYLDLHRDMEIPYVTGFKKINKVLSTITANVSQEIDNDFDLYISHDVLELSKEYHIQELHPETKSDHTVTNNMKTLVDVFTDLFMHNDEFSSKFISKLNDADNESSNYSNILELKQYILNLSKEMLINGVLDVNKVLSLANRLELSNDKDFEVNQLVDRIKVVGTEDTHYDNLHNTVLRLREQLQNILNQMGNHEGNAIVVNLNEIIYDFNLLAEKLSIDPVYSMSFNTDSHGISNTAILVLGANQNNCQSLELPAKIDKRFLLTTHGCNLASVTVDKLYDLLTFLDSLESVDNHYISLQNNILKELAERKKKDY